jgi:hypothetical protein
MRNLGTQAQPIAAQASLPQLVPSQTNPKPSGADQNLRVVLLQHPRGFPFPARRINRWWPQPLPSRSGTELCFVAVQAHPIGAHLELDIPLRSGTAVLRGNVTRIRQSGQHWETSISVAPEALARAALLARICELEARLHSAQPLVRVVEARRRVDDWQRLRPRLARIPALYAEILSSFGRMGAGGWPESGTLSPDDPPRPRGLRPQ